MNSIDYELGLKILRKTNDSFGTDASVKFKKRLAKDTLIVIMKTKNYEKTLYMYGITSIINDDEQLLGSWLAVFV